MRITNNLTTRNALVSLQKSLRAVDDAQHRATTGLRVEQGSDDPSAATAIVSAGSSLRAIEQYQRTINAASSRMASEEQALSSVTQLLERVKELAISQGTSTANAATRLTVKSEVDQILQAAIQLGNQKVDGEYLFGGDQSSAMPLTSSTPPFTAAAPTGSRRMEISSNLRITAGHNATDVFLNSGVLAAIDQLSTALAADDEVAIRASITSIDSAHAATQVLIGESGAQSAQLEIASANLGALDTSLRAFRSNLQDADLEKAVTDLVSRQTAYQAAMLATSRIMGMSLTDYLR
ncbi:MAG: flagellar hook-associated protein FlgL [Gemmatimonadetes bacterium]|nr:flagellar hook-associated protein FlgL [Gemmatimonadota bacterium]